MTAKIAALEANQTWTLTPLPVGKKPIGLSIGLWQLQHVNLCGFYTF